jgi:tetratricopeptide (TPR) repeat protein
MTGRHQDSVTPLTIVTGLAGVMFGIIVGYMLGVSQAGPGATAVAAAPAQTAAAAAAGVSPANEEELQAYRNVLASDPKNVRANVELGNRLYDARRYAEAIPYYQQAFTLDPKNVSVSTDLATALYYAGRADEALAQYAKSLAIDGTHAQTLFNVGIVRADGKGDYAGAVDAWNTLLRTNPSYPGAAKVRALISDAQSKVNRAS